MSAVYSLSAVFAFALFFSPFAGKHQLVSALPYATAVLLPFGLLIFADLLTCDRLSAQATVGAAVTASALSGYAYFFSFRYNDGEYWLVYLVVPAIQLLVVLLALAISLWRRHKRVRNAT